jgi:prevent-host-death family protein
MIVNVRESKARMSELLQRACAGEEVVISLRGQPKARLVPLRRAAQAPDMQVWAQRLKKRCGRQDLPKQPDSSVEIINDLRGDRW